MTTDFDSMDSERLREEAIRLFGKSDEAGHRHWSRLASLMGAIEDGRHYEKFQDGKGESFTSIRQWAEEDLGLPRSEVFVLRNLRKMLITAGPHVSMDEWRSVSRVRALIVRKALNLGGNPRDWYDKAITAETTRALQNELEVRGGADTGWTTWKVRVPVEMVGMLESKLAEAIPMALGPGEHDPKDPSIRFQLLEAIFSTFSASEPAIA